MRKLFLEERLDLVHKMLNEHTLDILKSLPEDKQLEFRQLINETMTVLMGDPFEQMRKKYK